MYVCICGAVTDHQIRCAVREGVLTFPQLQEALPVSRCCGRCKPFARKVLAEAIAAEFPSLPSRISLPAPAPA